MSCQKCRAPLKLDQSLQDLNPAAFDLLAGAQELSRFDLERAQDGLLPQDRRQKYEAAAQASSHPLFKPPGVPRTQGIGPVSQSGQRRGVHDNSTMSFVMLNDSYLGKPAPSPEEQRSPVGKTVAKPAYPLADGAQSLSHRIDSSTRLFEILSSRSDIDHPICNECTELLLSQFQVRLQSSTKERDAYVGFLKELRSSLPSETEIERAEKEDAASQKAESEAYEELLRLEKEKAELEDQVAKLDAESRKFDVEERAYWQQRNALDLELTSFRDSIDALKTSFSNDSQQLERLQRTNVYNDTFCIGHDGLFGTINGLRLGRLPPPNNVEWAEINAAWGQTALLLATIAERLGFSFKGYRIRPMGSTSRIEKIEAGPAASTASARSSRTAQSSSSRGDSKVTPLDLFSSGDLPLAKTLLHRKFNEAMVAFLDCLNQLGEFVRNLDRRSSRGDGLRLPYKIENDKIHGISIKLGVSQDEVWTGACKYTLTCCKFLLAHASDIGPSRSA